MRIVAHASLAGYWRRHPETMLGLKQWEQMVRQAQWRTMQEIVDSLSGVKVLNGERARFAISGGNYRLVVAFNFGAELLTSSSSAPTQNTTGLMP